MTRGHKRHREVMAAAAEIVRRLQETEATVSGFMDEYECGYATLKRAILTRIAPEEYRALCCKKLANGGIANRFRPGHIPWTQGVKDIHLSPATEFKPGHIRGASARKYRAIGSIVIRRGKPLSHRKDARHRQSSRWIKVRDDGPEHGRYMPYARWLWEQAHGPVPAGHFVVHKDNNLLHDQLDNLILVDRRRHMLRLRERPAVLTKCRARAAVALKRRRREGKAVRQSGLLRMQQVVWDCPACGAEVEPGTQHCPKCRGTQFEVREIVPMPDSMQSEAVVS